MSRYEEIYKEELKEKSKQKLIWMGMSNLLNVY